MIQATLDEQGLAAKAVDHVHLLPWIDEWVNAATFNRYLPGTPIVYVDAVITARDHQKPSPSGSKSRRRSGRFWIWAPERDLTQENQPPGRPSTSASPRDRHKQWEAGAREAEDPLSPAVQLPSYLCDNMRNVWHESRLYCPTAWTQRPDAALDLCPLVELKRRLGRDG